MPDLRREPTKADLEYALRPLKAIESQRKHAYKERRRNIEGAYNKAIRKIDTLDYRLSTEETNTRLEEVRFLESERDRKVEQLDAQYDAMLEKTGFEEFKAGVGEVLDHKVTKALGYASEAASRVKDAYEIATGTAAISQLGATGLLMTNPFTAAFAVLNLADQWIGRAIGWRQMAKKQWDADCSRISVKVARKIAQVYGDSEFKMSRTTGSVFAGADKSTIARQSLEKKLYHKIWNIREDVIKYKIVTVEMEEKAQKVLVEKNQVAQEVHGIEELLKRYKRSNLHRGVTAKEFQKLEAKQKEVLKKCLELSASIMEILNEAVENNTRLVNKAENDVTRMVEEILKSFEKTQFQGKFTGSHTHGSWRAAIRRAFS